jgi:hypothetical protein
MEADGYLGQRITFDGQIVTARYHSRRMMRHVKMCMTVSVVAVP